MTSIKTTARIAGFLYLLQIPLGVFGIIYVPKMLWKANDMSATVSAILANESLFRLGMVSVIVCALVTVATSVFIYKVLKPVSQGFAKWIVIFTLLVVPISMLNELNNVAILLLAKQTKTGASFTTEQLQTLMSLFFDIHRYGMQLVNIFFGLWLLPMGYLVIKSGYIPKFIGFFLLLTCVGYLVDFTIYFLFPTIKIVVSEYTWMGEVMMVIWLLAKGVNPKSFEKYDKA